METTTLGRFLASEAVFKLMLGVRSTYLVAAVGAFGLVIGLRLRERRWFLSIGRWT